MNRFPFYCLVLRGQHSHHPPLPSKLSIVLAKEVQDAFDSQDILTLTARMLSIC
jgi:hypothetical protein